VFLMRAAREGDLPALLELARYLDTPNLPCDRDFLMTRLERSAASFARPGPPAADREYQFVLEDESSAVVGTCAILAKHGTPGMPHVYLKVGAEKRQARSLKVSMDHRTFQLGFTEDGPTEIGALVLHPDVRGRPGWPGRLLSWGRFVFISLQRMCFEDRVLAEMRAAFDSQGRSAFWEAFGGRFTGISYAEADRRSATDKSFILDLFPSTPFYEKLLPADVAAQIGKVHAETEPAVRLLQRAGLRFNGEIDPFDAGPFYEAAMNDVVPVRDTRSVRLESDAPPDDAPPAILSLLVDGDFRAVATPCELRESSASVRAPKDAFRRLGVRAGEEISWTPLGTPAQEVK
jgi:arginine N-succinyltransferase